MLHKSAAEVRGWSAVELVEWAAYLELEGNVAEAVRKGLDPKLAGLMVLGDGVPQPKKKAPKGKG